MIRTEFSIYTLIIAAKKQQQIYNTADDNHSILVKIT